MRRPLSYRAKRARCQGSAAKARAVPLPTETTTQLPLFGHTVYVVLRVSKLALPGPVLLGLNRQHLVLMDPSSEVGSVPVLVPAGTRSVLTQSMATPPPAHQPLLCLLPQKLCCSIALKDLQRLHLMSPLEEDGPPGLELNYGSADNPQTIWLELPQVSDQASVVPREEALSVQPRWRGCGAALSRLCPAGPGVAAHHHLPAGQRVHSVARPLRRVEKRQQPLTGQSALVLL